MIIRKYCIRCNNEAAHKVVGVKRVGDLFYVTFLCKRCNEEYTQIIPLKLMKEYGFSF